MSKIKWIITLSICAALAFSLFIFFNKANFTEASENKKKRAFLCSKLYQLCDGRRDDVV